MSLSWRSLIASSRGMRQPLDALALVGRPPALRGGRQAPGPRLAGSGVCAQWHAHCHLSCRNVRLRRSGKAPARRSSRDPCGAHERLRRRSLARAMRSARSTPVAYGMRSSRWRSTWIAAVRRRASTKAANQRLKAALMRAGTARSVLPLGREDAPALAARYDAAGAPTTVLMIISVNVSSSRP